MITREEIEKRYNIQDGVIKTPGKYEGEGIETPYFYEYVLNGFPDGTIYLGSEAVDYMKIREEDIEEFSYLEGYDYFFLQYDNHGFVYGEPMEEEELLDSPHEEIRMLAE